MSLVSHGMRLGDGLKYHEVFLTAGRYGMPSLTLHAIPCVYTCMCTSMNVRKIKFNSYIYIIFGIFALITVITND